MPVRFVEITFHNDNNTPVTLTVEAPSGTVASQPQTVGANSSVTVPLGIDNCVSSLVVASDSTHGEWKQSFGMAAPSLGRQAYLVSIDVRYVIASFSGGVKAQTE